MSEFELRPYQEEAVQAALSHDGYGLFMEQRTGKTYVSLELSRRWRCTDILVVCPKKALPVWAAAIKLMGLKAHHYTLVNFESFMFHKEEYLYNRDLTVIDESHRIKERGSKVTQACWRLGRISRKRLILTGTPQGQGTEDYYAQLRFIRPDLFPSWKAFSERYLIIKQVRLPGREEDPFPKIVGYRNQEQFKELLKSMSYRVLRDEVSSVKTLVRRKIYKVSPSPEFMVDYEQMRDRLYLELQDALATAIMPMTQMMKLHQLCGGFIKDDTRVTHAMSQDKLTFLWNLVDTELKGHTYAIVANFKAEMDAISEGLTQRGISHVQIRGKHQYDPGDRSQVTILNPSAGESINLAHHNEMVIFSMNYSFLKWKQFLDRIVVVDTPEVIYHYLLMKGTADEVIYTAVINKRKLSDSVMEIFKK